MSKPATKWEWLAWGALVVVIGAVIGVFAFSAQTKQTSVAPLPIIGTVNDFALTNQNNEAISLKQFLGKIWVADVIFTRCPGPCVTMSRHLAEMQTNLAVNSDVRLVSFTSDPANDSPDVLQKYGAKFNADSNRWFFLTGPERDLRQLEVNDFKFVVVDKPAADREVPNDLFIHSTWFVLVDRAGKIRGWNDETGKLHAYFDSNDSQHRMQLINAVKSLEMEKHL